jgi:DNA mismatch endonuclease (patch repair protein)
LKKFVSSSERASYNHSKIKSADTKCELLLRSTLWRLGFRFRKNVKSLPGKPDIVFPKEKVAVFCDGDFWHGRNWRLRRRKLQRGSNPEFWISKIQGNIKRDALYNKQLYKLGWFVLRLWELDIIADPQLAASKVIEVMSARRKALHE